MHCYLLCLWIYVLLENFSLIWRWVERKTVNKKKTKQTNKQTNKHRWSIIVNAAAVVQWRSRWEHSPRMRKVGCSNSSRDRLESLKQVVSTPLLNARQQVWEPWVIITEFPCHSRCGTLKNPHCFMVMRAEHR